MSADITGGLQPGKDGGPLPGRLINYRLGILRQNARNIFPKAAAGEVGDSVYIDVFNQFQNRFYVDTGRFKQMIGQRLPFQQSGLWVAAANVNNFPHQRISIRVRAAGAECNQHVAFGNPGAVDDF